MAHKDKPNWRHVLDGVKEAGSITAYAKAIGKKRRIVSYWHAEALEEWRSGIESFGKLIGADLTMMNQLMGRGSSNMYYLDRV